MNRISVIIPTYQHASTLPRSLDSIFAQTRVPDEVIVVDDGSIDETAEVLEPYLDRVTYIRQENQGAPVARNNGFSLSTGEQVIFWDADVIGEPTMLEKLEETLNQHPGASWAYSSFWWGRKRFDGQAFSVQSIRAQNYIHTTALIRREDFPGFDESLSRFQDWDLWLTMAAQGKRGIFVDQPLYRVLVKSSRPAYSQWLPSFVYQLPWQWIGWMPRSIRAYKDAHAIIVDKHQL